MVKTSNIENAIDLALRAHKGQKDKAGAPYILHPLRVMLSMDTDIERKVAVLHDVIEDGGITPLKGELQ
jgi:(p)ppGpp synthase/HD superfamily hydrolase